MYKLRTETPDAWAQQVADELDTFLPDHAASERKASANAMHMVVRYSDKPELVDKMVEVAREELEHFHRVFYVMQERGVELEPDEADPYVNALLKHARSSGRRRLLDRLLMGSIIEYRGCERFAMLGRVLQDYDDSSKAKLADMYSELAASDSKHRADFYGLAELYFDEVTLENRLDELLDIEAGVVDDLPVRSALH